MRTQNRSAAAAATTLITTRMAGTGRQWQDAMKERAQRSLWWLSVVGAVALAEWTVVLYLTSPV